MFNNPLIERYRVSVLRPQMLWIYLVIYGVLVFLVLAFNTGAYRSDSGRGLEDLCKGVYYQFLAIQALIMTIWLPYSAGVAIKNEITEKTYDFFRMLPLSAPQKAAGILAGRNLLGLLLAGANLVFLLLFGVAGGVDLALQAQVIVVLAALAFVFSAAGVLLSTYATAKRHREGAVALVILVLFVLPPLIGLVANAMDTPSLEQYPIDFYHVKIPILVFISLVGAYLGGWAYRGMLRRFTREKEPLFSPGGVIGFLLGYLLIVGGVCWPYLATADAAGRATSAYFFWLASFAPLTILPFGTIRDYNYYLEYFGQDRPAATAPGVGTTFAGCSNLTLWIGLAAAWIIPAFAYSLAAGLPPLRSAQLLFSYSTAFLFYLLLIETYVVYAPVFNRIHLLVGFILLVYLFLPLLVEPVFGLSGFYVYSPGGFWADLFDGDGERIASHFVWAVNLALSAVPAGLIAARYQRLRTARAAM